MTRPAVPQEDVGGLLKRAIEPDADGLFRTLPETEELRAEKRAVQDFYDETGWQQDEAGVFADTALFVDPRPRVEAYMARCRARVKGHLPAGGRHLLDVACGPVHFPEYQAYSSGFDTRVCIDLSSVALRAARRNLGDHGAYIQGDITAMPFKDDTMDAVVSMHALYHVPKDEQANAFREIHRVLKPGGTAVVVYYWQTPSWRDLPPLSRLAVLPVRVVQKGLRKLRPVQASESENQLYYFAHTRQWFEQQDWPFEAQILSWSAVNTDTLRRFIPRGRIAQPILAGLYRLEEKLPRLLGRYGRYPMIVIRK
ncbi:class I SAM-dependent methyltransferase [Solirubrobacter soli]|uniref:class I SAM-dependent methyltransferase n=1 Tax=Solirubrobacter soli TaxID=363832 RepID=UPI001B7FAC56|nr:class I SAM-dependent methyltransferase [Solirubrobacter soli]